MGFRNTQEKLERITTHFLQPSLVTIKFPTSLKDLEIVVNTYSAGILLSKPDELKSQNITFVKECNFFP